MQMTAGETRSFGDYTFKMRRVSWADDVKAALRQGGMEVVKTLPSLRVYADVDVTYKGRTTTVRPGRLTDPKGTYSLPAHLPGAPNAIITMDEFNPPQQAILSTTNVPDPLEAVSIDVSVKPMIWLVFLGTILYTLGGTIAYRRRALENGLLGDEPEEKPAPSTDPDTRSRRERRRSRNRSPVTEPARAEGPR